MDPNDESIEYAPLTLTLTSSGTLQRKNATKSPFGFFSGLPKDAAGLTCEKKGSTSSSSSKRQLVERSISSDSVPVSIDYGYIPEFDIFHRFCCDDFPGVKEVETTVQKASMLKLTTVFGHDQQTSYSGSNGTLHRADSPNSIVGDLPTERIKNFFGDRTPWKKDKSSDVQPEQHPVAPATRKVLRPPKPLKWRSRPQRHLASLLVMTPEYVHLKVDWEVCREIFSMACPKKKHMMTYETCYETLRQMGTTHTKKKSLIPRKTASVSLEHFFLMFLEATNRIHLVINDDPLSNLAFWDLQRNTQKMTLEEATQIVGRLMKADLISCGDSQTDLIRRLNCYGDSSILLDDVFKLLKQSKKTLQDYEHTSEVRRRVRRSYSVTFSNMDLSRLRPHSPMGPCYLKYFGCLKDSCSHFFQGCCGVV